MATGAWRDTDPATSEDAARSIDTTTIKLAILQALKEQAPRNGWELSLALEMATISVVPRLAPMREDGWIVQLGTRPGPTGRAQIAYALTDLGIKVLGGPPMHPIDYARSIWPKGFTEPELCQALHMPDAPIEELRQNKMIEDTGVRRESRIVWRYRPYQLPLPLDGGANGEASR